MACFPYRVGVRVKIMIPVARLVSGVVSAVSEMPNASGRYTVTVERDGGAGSATVTVSRSGGSDVLMLDRE